MSLIGYALGQTSIKLRLHAQNSSTGGGLTGVTHSSSGLIVSTIADNESSATAYTAAAGNVETITTLGTFATPTTGKCRLKEVDATNHPGLYELQIDNARYAVSGAKELTIYIHGVANMQVTPIKIPLTTVDPYSSTFGLGTLACNLVSILGTSLTETVGGYLAAGFKKLFDVASPALTMASVNQTGDSYARIGAPSGASLAADILSLYNRLGAPAGVSTAADIAGVKSVVDAIGTAVTNLNNLSAKANIFGSALLEIPDSSTRVYLYTMVVRDDEDKLVDLDASPTLTLTNASGTDRSALLSAVSHPSTGQYTWTITVGTSTNNESLTLTATGAYGAETRLAKLGLQVVDYDTATAIAAIQSAVATVQSTFPSNFAALQITADGKIGPLATNAITSGVIDTDAIGASELSDAAANKVRDSVVTKILKYLRLMVRKDSAVATDHSTELGELNANTGTGTGAFANTTDASEAIRDNMSAGGGDATAANQTAMLKLLQADVTLNTGTTPYRLVYKEAGTETVLLQKELTQEDGTDVTSIEHRIANQVAP